MSSTEPGAVEAAAWERAVLDELGGPPSGLSLIRPREAARPRPYTASSAEPVPAAEKTSFDPAPHTRPSPPAGPVPTAEATSFDLPRPASQGPRRSEAPPRFPVAPPDGRRGSAAPPGSAGPRGGPADALQAAPAPAPPGRPPGQAPHPESLLHRPRHGDPLLRRLTREIRKVAGASQDVHQDTHLAELIQQPVTTGRRIAVTSIRGGAGKSIVAALVATALAHFRQDRVLALDADPGIGSLMLRLGMVDAPSLRRLVTGRASSATFDGVRPYLAQTDGGVWALGGTDRGSRPVDLAAYEAVTNMLGRFFGVTVTDCGAGLTGELQEGVLADAHAQILVTPATPDGAFSARRALELLVHERGEFAARTVVVFVAHAAGTGVDVRKAASLLPPWDMPVEHLRFDRHLADGSLIDPTRLAEPTRVTALRIAADALTLAAGRSLPQ